jgi:hypothetical protein
MICFMMRRTICSEHSHFPSLWFKFSKMEGEFIRFTFLNLLCPKADWQDYTCTYSTLIPRFSLMEQQTFTYLLFSLALQPSAGYGLHVHEVSWSHTTTRHSRYDSSERVISWQHTTENIHAPGGIKTHDRSGQTAVDFRHRPRGHWDRRRPLLVRDYLPVRCSKYVQSMFKVRSLVQALLVSKELKGRGIFSKICYNTPYVGTHTNLGNVKLHNFGLTQFEKLF